MADDHTERDRIDALGHLSHEISTMIEAWRRVEEIDRTKTGEALERIAYLECALLHARALIEFLAVTTAQREAMTPTDFVRKWDYRQTAELRKELGALNEHLAHLSWKRTSDRAGTLSDDVLERILGGCEAFYAAAAGTAGVTQVRAALDKAKSLSIPDPGSGPRYRNVVLSTSNPPYITMGGWPKPKDVPDGPESR
jgi:hypothetical protein